MDWARILAYITGTVDQELLLRNEYLAAENRILKAQLKTPLRLTDAERMTLAEIAHRLGRKALDDVANTAKPDTIMGWYRRLIARKFDGSKSRRYPGRPRIDVEIEQLVVRMAKDNAVVKVPFVTRFSALLRRQHLTHVAEPCDVVVGSRQKHGTGWRTTHRDVEVGELHSLLCKRIEVRSINLAAEASNVCPTHVIGHNQQDIGLPA